MDQEHETIRRYWRKFGFSTRVTFCLANVEIKTKLELALLPDIELLRLQNFGRKSLAEVRAKVPHRRPRGPREMQVFKRTLKRFQKHFWAPGEPFKPPAVAILRHPGDPISTTETGTTYHHGIYWPRHQ